MSQGQIWSWGWKIKSRGEDLSSTGIWWAEEHRQRVRWEDLGFSCYVGQGCWHYFGSALFFDACSLNYGKMLAWANFRRIKNSVSKWLWCRSCLAVGEEWWMFWLVGSIAKLLFSPTYISSTLKYFTNWKHFLKSLGTLHSFRSSILIYRYTLKNDRKLFHMELENAWER